MSLSVLLAMGRIFPPDEVPNKKFKSNLKYLEIRNPEILADVIILAEKHPIQAKIKHAYNLVIGNYYF